MQESDNFTNAEVVDQLAIVKIELGKLKKIVEEKDEKFNELHEEFHKTKEELWEEIKDLREYRKK